MPLFDLTWYQLLIKISQQLGSNTFVGKRCDRDSPLKYPSELVRAVMRSPPCTDEVPADTSHRRRTRRRNNEECAPKGLSSGHICGIIARYSGAAVNRKR